MSDFPTFDFFSAMNSAPANMGSTTSGVSTETLSDSNNRRPLDATVDVSSYNAIDALAQLGVRGSSRKLIAFIAENYGHGDNLRADLSVVLSRFSGVQAFAINMTKVDELNNADASELEQFVSRQSSTEELLDNYRAFELLVAGDVADVDRIPEGFKIWKGDTVVEVDDVYLQFNDPAKVQILLNALGALHKKKYKFVPVPKEIRTVMNIVVLRNSISFNDGVITYIPKTHPELASGLGELGLKGGFLDAIVADVKNHLRSTKFNTGMVPGLKKDPAGAILMLYYRKFNGFVGFPKYDFEKLEQAAKAHLAALDRQLQAINISKWEDYQKFLSFFQNQLPMVLTRLEKARIFRSLASKLDHLSHNMFAKNPEIGALGDEINRYAYSLWLLRKARNEGHESLVILGQSGHHLVEVCRTENFPFLVIDNVTDTSNAGAEFLYYPSLSNSSIKDLAPYLSTRKLPKPLFVYTKTVGDVPAHKTKYDVMVDEYFRMVTAGFPDLMLRFDYPSVTTVPEFIKTAAVSYKTVAICNGNREHNSELWLRCTSLLSHKREVSAPEVTGITNTIRAFLDVKGARIVVTNEYRNIFLKLGFPFVHHWPAKETSSEAAAALTWWRKTKKLAAPAGPQPVSRDSFTLPDFSLMQLSSFEGLGPMNVEIPVRSNQPKRTEPDSRAPASSPMDIGPPVFPLRSGNANANPSAVPPQTIGNVPPPPVKKTKAAPGGRRAKTRSSKSEESSPSEPEEEDDNETSLFKRARPNAAYKPPSDPARGRK
jgi:hypothetical protein